MKNNAKFEKLYNNIIIILSVIAVALAIIDLSIGLSGYMIYIDYVILAFFAIDYFARLFMAKDKYTFFKKNIFDLIAIIPFNTAFRIFRVTRLSRLLRITSIATNLGKTSRLVSAFIRFVNKIDDFITAHGFKYVLMVISSLIFIGAIGIHYSENKSLLDSLWYSFITVFTVGYAEFAPATALGRFITFVLIVCGIGLIGSLTSNITSFFIRKKNPSESKIDYMRSLKH